MNLGFVLLYEDDSPCPPASDNVKAPDALFPPDIAVYTTISPVILGPNITGRIVPGGGGGRYIGMDQESGAFSSESGTGGGGYTVNAGPTGLLFNASKASNIYNDVATIQPSSGYSLIIIKE